MLSGLLTRDFDEEEELEGAASSKSGVAVAGVRAAPGWGWA